MRKLVVEVGWVHERMYDFGWSDEKKCERCKARRNSGCATVHLGGKRETSSRRDMKNVKGGLKVAKEHYVVSSQR